MCCTRGKLTVVTDILGSKIVKLNTLVYRELFRTLENANDVSVLLICSSLCYNGTQYSKGMAVVIDCNDDDCFIFRNFFYLFLYNENAYIVYNEFKSNAFDYHFHSYVTPSESLSLINIKVLFNFLPLHI